MSALTIYDDMYRDIQENNLSNVKIAEQDSPSVKTANVTFLFLESYGVNCKYCHVRFKPTAIQSHTEKCKGTERPSKRKRFHDYLEKIELTVILPRNSLPVHIYNMIAKLK